MFIIPTKFTEKTYEKCVAELERMLCDIPINPDIEKSLLDTFAIMEGSNNPLSQDSEITSRAEAYGLITSEEVIELVMRDIKAKRTREAKTT